MKSIQYSPRYRRMVQYVNDHFPVLLAKMRFRKLFGQKLNLKNPQDLNEKILWLSLYSDTSLWTRCADKYAVREYVEEKGLGDILVKLYGKWDRVEDIDWENLPNSFVMKTNNGAGTVMIVEDKDKLDLNKTKTVLKKWLAKDIAESTTEFHYRRIVPCIIAEELLALPAEEDSVSTTMIDYKIWCFNGVPDSFLICSNRTTNGCCLSAYDTKWNNRDEALVFGHGHDKRDSLVPQPKNLDNMLAVAEKLSEDFPEVRVDLYNIDGRIYFGELTFTSYGGTMTYYTSAELLRMGKKIDLSWVKKTH